MYPSGNMKRGQKPLRYHKNKANRRKKKRTKQSKEKSNDNNIKSNLLKKTIIFLSSY